MGYRVRHSGEYLPTVAALKTHLGEGVKVPALITHDWLESHALDPVLEGAQATGGTVYQYSAFAGLEQINGVWHTKYVLGPTFTEDKILDEQEYKKQKDDDQAANARQIRNQKLKDSDWTQIGDSPLTPEKRQEWVAYRQTLRDITALPGFPWTFEWPEEPEMD